MTSTDSCGCDARRTVLRAMLAVAGMGMASAPLAAQQAERSAARPLVFDQVNVVDVRTGQVRSGQRVVVIGTRIQGVGSAAKIPAPRGAEVVDARGKYLIPGFWDMHVHAGGTVHTYIPYMPFIAHGVTGVREMGTPVPLDTIHRWRRAIASGQEVGPRIVASGPYLEGDSTNGRLAAVVATPADAKRIVDSLKAAGADFLKVHFNNDPPETRKVGFAIMAEARRVGLPVVGHQIDSLTIAESSDSGQRTFEHTLFMHTPCWASDPAGERACAAEMAHVVRNKGWITPTVGGLLDTLPRQPGWMATYVPDSSPTAFHGMTQDGLWMVHKLRKLGVGFLAASDAMVGFHMPPEYPDSMPIREMSGHVHDELALLVEAGLTPLEALQAATLNPAKYLDATDSLGTIAPRKLADLVLLDANPLDDIKNTTKISAVVANGRYFDRAALDSVTAQTMRGIRGH